MPKLIDIFSPVVLGLAQVDRDQPALYVSNHTSPFALDILVLYMTLSQEAGIRLTALAHHSMFFLPGSRSRLESLGIYEGTRANCRKLMAEGKPILVFPGGSRELFKNKDHKYKLDWADRVGFVRMAVEHGYPIIPVAKIGAEDHFDIRIDSGDWLQSPLGSLLRKMDLTLLPPIVSGWHNTLLPKPERYYFQFMPAIATSQHQGREGDHELCLDIRKQVKDSLEQAIAELQAVRAADPLRNPLQRLAQIPARWRQRRHAG